MPMTKEEVAKMIEEKVAEGMAKALKNISVPEGMQRCKKCGRLIYEDGECPYCKKDAPKEEEFFL